MTKPLIGLAVGHSRWSVGRPEGGAISVGGVSEYAYNSDLASRIRKFLAQAGVQSLIYNKYEGSGYSSAMSWLANQMADDEITTAVELHFNSAGPSATGHEWLHYKSSTKGKALANALDQEFDAVFPALKSRGVHPPESGRGDAFLQKTHCPAVICEPFFGSNQNDWRIATDDKDLVAKTIANGILAYLGVPKV